MRTYNQVSRSAACFIGLMFSTSPANALVHLSTQVQLYDYISVANNAYSDSQALEWKSARFLHGRTNDYQNVARIRQIEPSLAKGQTTARLSREKILIDFLRPKSRRYWHSIEVSTHADAFLYDPAYVGLFTHQSFSTDQPILRWTFRTERASRLSLFADGQIDQLFRIDDGVPIELRGTEASFDLEAGRTYTLSLFASVYRENNFRFLPDDWTNEVGGYAHFFVDETIVPEPYTWSMFVIGFGITGSFVRRWRNYSNRDVQV